MTGAGDFVLDRVAGPRISLADAYQTERQRVRVLMQLIKVLAEENAQVEAVARVDRQFGTAKH